MGKGQQRGVRPGNTPIGHTAFTHSKVAEIEESSTVDNSDPFDQTCVTARVGRLLQKPLISRVIELGNSLVGTEVTICGYAETRGRGAICFLMLRDGTGKIQAFLKRDNMDELV